MYSSGYAKCCKKTTTTHNSIYQWLNSIKVFLLIQVKVQCGQKEVEGPLHQPVIQGPRPLQSYNTTIFNTWLLRSWWRIKKTKPERMCRKHTHSYLPQPRRDTSLLLTLHRQEQLRCLYKDKGGLGKVVQLCP